MSREVPPGPPAGNADEAGILQAIAEDPDDDLPRLAHADWFEENGDPDRARLIRLQVASLDGPPSQEENDLIAANLDRWLGPLRPFVEGAGFEGGALNVVVGMRTFFRKAFQAGAPGWFGQARASGLWVKGRTSRWGRLADSPVLAAARELRVDRAGMSDADLGALLASPHLAHLHTLRLGDHPPGSVFDVVTHVPTLPRLRRLFLPMCSTVSHEQLAALLAGPGASRLTTLDLSINWMKPAQAVRLAESPSVAGLRCLDLSNNDLGGLGIAALASSPHLGNLTRLTLHNCYFGEDGARALASSPHLGKLRALRVSNNFIRDEGAWALAESATLASCRLNMRLSGVTEEAQAELRRRFGDRVSFG